MFMSDNTLRVRIKLKTAKREDKTSKCKRKPKSPAVFEARCLLHVRFGFTFLLAQD